MITVFGRGRYSALYPFDLPSNKLLLLCLLSLLIFCTALTAHAEPNRSLKACGHPFYPPVSWHSENRLMGLAPEVTKQLFAELGFKVQLSADSNWKRCLLEVEQGNADIIVAAYRISSREAYLRYSEHPIIADKVILFVNRQQPMDFTHLRDLRGKTVGLLLGDSWGDKFDHFIRQNSRIEYVSRGGQNFSKLALGRIDYMPGGKLSGQLQSRKLGFHDQIMALDTEITTEHYYLAIGRHSGLDSYLPYLNQRLKEMNDDGTIERLRSYYSFQYLNTP